MPSSHRYTLVASVICTQAARREPTAAEASCSASAGRSTVVWAAMNSGSEGLMTPVCRRLPPRSRRERLGREAAAHRCGGWTSPRRREILQVRQRSEEHTSELQSRGHLVCRLLLEKK